MVLERGIPIPLLSCWHILKRSVVFFVSSSPQCICEYKVHSQRTLPFRETNEVVEASQEYRPKNTSYVSLQRTWIKQSPVRFAGAFDQTILSCVLLDAGAANSFNFSVSVCSLRCAGKNCTKTSWRYSYLVTNWCFSK